MHNLYFVLVPKDEHRSSFSARSYAEATLEEEGFVGNDTFFGCGKSDWFVIGGRWSGLLSETTWAKDVVKRIGTLENDGDIQVRGVSYGRKKDKKKQERLRKKVEQMWEKAAPKKYKGIGYDRDSYNTSGYEDDAMPLTDEIIDTLAERYEDVEVFISDEPDEISISNLKESKDIDKEKYWIVVVDYHI